MPLHTCRFSVFGRGAKREKSTQDFPLHFENPLDSGWGRRSALPPPEVPSLAATTDCARQKRYRLGKRSAARYTGHGLDPIIDQSKGSLRSVAALQFTFQQIWLNRLICSFFSPQGQAGPALRIVQVFVTFELWKDHTVARIKGLPSNPLYQIYPVLCQKGQLWVLQLQIVIKNQKQNRCLC